MGSLKVCQKCAKRINVSNFISDLQECQICAGLLYNLENLARNLWSKAKNFEFQTFQTGTKLKKEVREIEKKFVKETTQSLRYQFNKEFNKIFKEISQKQIDYRDPDIFFLYDQAKGSFSLRAKPLYIYGRYRKLKRGLPQTHWDCKACQGKGCPKCNYTGKKYQESVEELIANPVLKFTKGEKAFLHGSGREDVDVRMLGNGRPFVLEVANPKIRNINLQELEKEINQKNKNKIEVLKLEFTEKSKIAFLKSAAFPKVYLVKVLAPKEIDCLKLKSVLKNLEAKIIFQKTPKRVVHRRPNLVRKRRIFKAELKSCSQKEALIEIEAESGLYIKELVNGDQGRTEPSLSKLTGIPLEVKELDVIEIKNGQNREFQT